MGTVEDYINYYRRKADKTKANRRGVLRDFKSWLDSPLDQATREDVQDWIDHKEGDGLKHSTLNQNLGILKKFFSWLSHELPEPVGADEVRETLEKRREFERISEIERLEEGESGEKALTPNQIGLLIEKAERWPHEQVFVLCPYFGLRRDELRLLRAEDVDMDERSVTIRRETTKTPAGVRKTYFPPQLDEYLKPQEEQKYVVGHGDRPYDPSFFFHFIRRYDDLVGFHLRTKQFRSTFNTHMRDILTQKLGRAKGDFVLKKLMGHKIRDSDMSDHYMGVTEELERDKKRAMTDWHYLVNGSGKIKQL